MKQYTFEEIRKEPGLFHSIGVDGVLPIDEEEIFVVIPAHKSSGLDNTILYYDNERGLETIEENVWEEDFFVKSNETISLILSNE